MSFANDDDTPPPTPSHQDIKARLRVVCICKGIKQGRILDAIAGGCDTREKVNQKTGSGSGGCNATRCGPVIEELLKKDAQKKAEKMAGQEGLEPPTS